MCVCVCGMGDVDVDVDVWIIWIYGWCGCISSVRVCVYVWGSVGSMGVLMLWICEFFRWLVWAYGNMYIVGCVGGMGVWVYVCGWYGCV